MTEVAARRLWRSRGYSFFVAHGLRLCPEWSTEMETAPVCYAKPVAV
nr:hypothetical protein [Armatimonas sp.]